MPFLSCGDDPVTGPGPQVPAPEPEPPRPASISLSASSLSLSALGDTVRLSAEVRDQFGGVLSGSTVSWSSADPAVAGVSDAGLVTAAGNGETTITATSGSARATATVSVTQSAAAVVLSPESLAFASLGDTARLLASVRDGRDNVIEGAAVTWASSDPDVASVSETGLVAAAGNGETTITATSGPARATATVSVMQSAAAVVVSPESLVFASLGDTARLLASVRDGRDNVIEGAAVAWASSDPDVASVSETGLVAAAGNGETTITATAGSARATATVSVTQSAAAVVVSPERLAFASLGDTARLLASVRDGRDNVIEGAAVAWASSDPDVASVSETGLVAAAGNGETTITATSGSARATATVSVTQSAAAVVVSPERLAFASLGDTARLLASVRDGRDNVVEGAAVAWASSDPDVASVSETGLVAAAGNGETTITATSGSARATATVSVTQSAAAVVLSPERLAFASLGDTARLLASVRDGRDNVIEGAAVTWASSDPDVASVSETGLVTATGSGEATITAASDTLSAAAVVSVMQSAEMIDLDPDSIEFTSIGDTARITAVVRDGRGSPIESAVVTWSSSDSAVAAVDSAGLVTAIAVGDAAVTAAVGGVGAQARISVVNVPASIAITSPRLVLVAPRDTVRLDAAVQDARGNDIEAAVRWRSSDDAVATVDRDGLVTAVREGSATITASAGETLESSVEFTVVFARRVTVSPDNAILNQQGDTIQLEARVYDRLTRPIEGAPVAWSSSDPTVVSVDESGLATASGYGNVTITAMSGAASGTGRIHVIPAGFDLSLRITPQHIVLPRPLVQQKLTAETVDGAGQPYDPPSDVTWSTTDSTVVAVTETGAIIGLRKGTATIVATSKELESSDRAAVVVESPERDALVALYHATDGDNWVNNDGWLSDRPLWQFPGWYGVVTHFPDSGLFGDSTFSVPSNADSFELPSYENLLREWENAADDFDIFSATDPAGRVGVLALPENNLNGSIPPELGALEELNLLDLSTNSLESSLPQAIGDLPHLFIVGLYENEITGAIPDFGRSSVVLLDLKYNRFESLSGGLGGPALVQLSLSGNRLRGVLPNLPVWHPNLFGADWFDNDGLCHPNTAEIKAWLEAGADDLFFRSMAGPRCGLPEGPPAMVSIAARHSPEFDAVGDSVDFRVIVTDSNWVRTDVPAESIVLTSVDPTVASAYTTAEGKHFVRSEGSGRGLVLVTAGGATASNPGELGVVVDQVATRLAGPSDIAIPAHTTRRIDVRPVDRNGHAGPVTGPIRSTSTDPDVATAYRNGVVTTKAPGTARLAFWSNRLRDGERIEGAVTVTVTAASTGTAPAIAGVSPSPLVPGEPAAITGRNLGSETATTVLIDGKDVAVDSATAGTTLWVTVPVDSPCDPGRNVAIVVTSNGLSDDFLIPLASSGGDVVLSDLPVGALHGPVTVWPDAGLCLRSEAGEDAEYLIGVQGAYKQSTNLQEESVLGAPFAVDIAVTADDGAAANRVPVAPRLGDPGSAAGGNPDDADDVISRHRAAEQLLRREEEAALRSLRRGSGTGLGFARTPPIDRTVSVGDVVQLRYPGSRVCSADYLTLPSRIMAVGERVVIASDVDNPEDYDAASYEQFARELDSQIYPALIDYFGEPTDVNDDGRITIFFTKEVNRQSRGLLGWVSPVHLLKDNDLAAAEDEFYCPASNEMEIFFGRTPDGTSVLNEAELLRIMPKLIAHEVTHIIQGRRFDPTQQTRPGLGMVHWFAEGQAVLAEEIVGHAVLGRSTGNDYSTDVVFDNAEGERWYADLFGDFRQYFNRFAGGPQACSWWAQGDNCGARSLWYSVGWSFLRWVSDQYGPSYPGGEAGLHEDLIDSSIVSDWGAIEDATSVAFETLLAGWGAALYLDDRVEDETVQFTSWNLRDIFAQLEAPLVPDQLRFSDHIELQQAIVPGSAMYRLLAARGGFEATSVLIQGYWLGLGEFSDVGTELAVPQVFVFRVR